MKENFPNLNHFKKFIFQFKFVFLKNQEKSMIFFTKFEYKIRNNAFSSVICALCFFTLLIRVDQLHIFLLLHFISNQAGK